MANPLLFLRTVIYTQPHMNYPGEARKHMRCAFYSGILIGMYVPQYIWVFRRHNIKVGKIYLYMLGYDNKAMNIR